MGREEEVDKGRCVLGVRGILDDGDIGRYQGGDRRIAELDREASGLRREAQEIDRDAELTGVDSVRNAEAALGDGLEIAADLLPEDPALFPTCTLEHRLHRQMGGAGT